MNKAELQEWKAHPVTEQYLKDVEQAIQEVKEMPRIYENVDQTAIKNARYDGMIEAFGELKDWYNNRLEEFDED